MAVHDDQTGKDFGGELLKPICGNCGTRHLLPCTKGGPVQSGGRNTVIFTDGGVIHNAMGGGGGTSKCEVIPHSSERGYSTEVRTPLSPKVNDDGTIPCGNWAHPLRVSTGCPICDDLMMRSFQDQAMFERWYHHYVGAERRGYNDFVITHLEFIMKHMMDYVTPDTVLPDLPGKQPAKIEEAVAKKKSDMSRTDKWCDLFFLPLLQSIMGSLIVLLVISAVFFAVGVRTVSYHDFDMIMAGSIGFPLLYNFIRAGKTYINSRK